MNNIQMSSFLTRKSIKDLANMFYCSTCKSFILFPYIIQSYWKRSAAMGIHWSDIIHGVLAAISESARDETIFGGGDRSSLLIEQMSFTVLPFHALSLADLSNAKSFPRQTFHFLLAVFSNLDPKPETFFFPAAPWGSSLSRILSLSPAPTDLGPRWKKDGLTMG